MNSACIEPPPSPPSHAPPEPPQYSLAAPQIPSTFAQGHPDGTTPYRLYKPSSDALSSPARGIDAQSNQDLSRLSRSKSHLLDQAGKTTKD